MWERVKQESRPDIGVLSKWFVKQNKDILCQCTLLILIFTIGKQFKKFDIVFFILQRTLYIYIHVYITTIVIANKNHTTQLQWFSLNCKPCNFKQLFICKVNWKMNCITIEQFVSCNCKTCLIV